MLKQPPGVLLQLSYHVGTEAEVLKWLQSCGNGKGGGRGGPTMGARDIREGSRTVYSHSRGETDGNWRDQLAQKATRSSGRDDNTAF